MKYFRVSFTSRAWLIFFNFILIVFAIDKPSEINNVIESVPKKWLTQLFQEAQINFDIDPAVNSKCLEDFNIYKESLNAQFGWAIRMLESSEWPTVGLLSGTTTHLGNWDECLLVSTHHLQGKYCLMEGSYNFTKLIKQNSVSENEEWPSDELTVWEILYLFEKNPVRFDRKTVRWAICVPSSCSSTDLEISLKNILYPIFQNQGLDFKLHSNQSACYMKDEIKPPDEYHYAVMFFFALISIVCLSTLYDVFQQPKKGFKNSELNELLLSFSLTQNPRQLFQYSKQKDYGAVYAMKFVCIIIIIYGHRRIYSLGYPTFNPEDAEINFKRHVNYFELTHFTLVDVFFMLTGFLTFHLNFSSMHKHGFRYWIVAIIHRWLRLIPTFGVVMIFLIYIFPYIGEGPLWDAKVSNEINHCRDSWWTNMLAISNIVDTENQCLIVSWYMSVDMHLTVIGFGLLYITTRSIAWGWIASILTLIIGAIITFTAAYINKFHGILPTDVRFLQNPYLSQDFIHFYIASYTRIGPYIVGVITALITKMLNEKKFKFSTRQKILGIILAFIIGEGYLHLGFVMVYEFNHKFNALEHAFYAATYRSIYVIASALIMCIYFTTGFSLFEIIYENCFIAIFGRLTYSVFIINTVVQLFHGASQKSILPSSSLINRYWWVISDVLLSYFFGFFLFVFLESPIANVSKLVKQRLLKRNIKADISHSHIKNEKSST